ncbi:GNAT family N-acetyltransferase [Bacillus sp. FSL K6-3431]|uniref:GNAT family N-acetyltransferase n=1 Tax=Bacillus sp. FSL K6-3431 TaxID=2921500 RepID=UPI0030F86CBF
MRQEVIIFEGNEKDHLSAILRMRLDLERHMAKSNPGYWISDEKSYLESCQRYLNNKDVKVHLACLQGTEQIIGMGISVIEYHEDFSIKITGNIHHLWVDPEYRKKNVGKAIVTEIIKFFKHREVEELILDYSHGNIEAERFWSKLGYTPSIIMCSNTIKNIETKLS